MVNMSRAERALRMTAQKHGVSYETVIKEIEFAISDAIETARRNNDMEKLAMWSAIPCKGDIPTAKEMVAYFMEMERIGGLLHGGEIWNS